MGKVIAAVFALIALAWGYLLLLAINTTFRAAQTNWLTALGYALELVIVVGIIVLYTKAGCFVIRAYNQKEKDIGFKD